MADAPDIPILTETEAAAVDAMLGVAGLSPSDGERERLHQMYAVFKPGIEALYALPEARYEAPALVFQAAPKLAAWGA
jgi:hypothetical protein